MALRMTGKARETAEQIVNQFATGNVPEVLATTFINFANGDTPMSRWSWRNQFLAILQGGTDVRGYNQWKQVDRFVKAGKGRQINILAPNFRTITEDDPETGEETKRKIITGFRAQAVYDISQTDGQPLEVDPREAEFLDALPFTEVAQEWGIDISTYNATGGNALGWFSHGGKIGLGVENTSTWVHELVHAADLKLGTITKKNGQQVDNEVVAELGGATILTMIGQEYEADLGGAYQYINHYASKAGKTAAEASLELLDRVGKAVSLILETSQEVATS